MAQMLRQLISKGPNRINEARGFTLIEIIIAIAVSLIMIFAIGIAIESASRSSGGIERKVTAQQDARGALEIMALEIKMASYNPAFSTTIWRSDGNPGGANFCTTQSANQAYKGIQEATPNSITVEMDIAGGTDANGNSDGNGVLIGNPATELNEIIRYNFVQAGDDRYITRETNCGGGQPFLGDTIASGNPRTVRIINADFIPPIPVFRYFDGQATELLPIAASAGANQSNCLPGCTGTIRMVEITLAVETDEIDPSTGLTRRMIYKTRETLRNN
ncbi:MAG TPA: prepilin-type N-terminal cleavage/methylation domain-containing protein [Syntrophales bacterium]|nr:prepilin-type N-terminal cleavage/methylation domain-containing protein [Syntrophales bacterium]